MPLSGGYCKGFPATRCCGASPDAVTGQADEPSFAPALAEIEEALVPALIVEKLEDGSYTVLVPSVPTPMAGAIYILPPRTGASGRHAVYRRAQGVLKMGLRRR
jgi:hypothetical protein